MAAELLFTLLNSLVNDVASVKDLFESLIDSRNLSVFSDAAPMDEITYWSFIFKYSIVFASWVVSIPFIPSENFKKNSKGSAFIKSSTSFLEIPITLANLSALVAAFLTKVE